MAKGQARVAGWGWRGVAGAHVLRLLYFPTKGQACVREQWFLILPLFRRY